MSRGSVLVLDAHGGQAQHISKMLEKEKWSAILAFDQKMALSMMRATKFHLLMFEAYVGPDSTFRIMDQIRERAPSTPLAIMADTIYGRQGVQQTFDQARALGAEFIMPKPFSPERLKTLLTETTKFHRDRKGKKHLLIVEDNANLRTLISTVLGEMGYQISLAETMEQAFAKTNLDMVDVVIADIFMPGMGGIEGIMKIRSEWPHINIIAMSAGIENKVDPKQVLAASRHVGAVEQLSKPFDMGDLIHLVAKVLAQDSETAPVVPTEVAKAG